MRRARTLTSPGDCGMKLASYHRDGLTVDRNLPDPSEEETCGGPLRDTIVHFGGFEDDVFQSAVTKSEEADLSLCLGKPLAECTVYSIAPTDDA